MSSRARRGRRQCRHASGIKSTVTFTRPVGTSGRVWPGCPGCPPASVDSSCGAPVRVGGQRAHRRTGVSTWSSSSADARPTGVPDRRSFSPPLRSNSLARRSADRAQQSRDEAGHSLASVAPARPRCAAALWPATLITRYADRLDLYSERETFVAADRAGCRMRPNSAAKPEASCRDGVGANRLTGTPVMGSTGLARADRLADGVYAFSQEPVAAWSGVGFTSEDP